MTDLNTSPDDYFTSRLEYDRKREVLWSTLCDAFFSGLVSDSDCVMELGAGWCDFINSIHASRRVAVDLWDGITDHAAPGVETHVTSVTDLSFAEPKSVDVIFASNLVEHLDRASFVTMLAECGRVLAHGGRLVLLQPNFRLCSNRYFDDFTHVAIWSDVSLAGFLESKGWRLEQVCPRFLPLSVKSRLPVVPRLIRAYLRSPIKPLAGQMLVVARPPLHSVGPDAQAPPLS
jgi:SAM-dependent methyltransferase